MLDELCSYTVGVATLKIKINHAIAKSGKYHGSHIYMGPDHIRHIWLYCAFDRAEWITVNGHLVLRMPTRSR